MSINREQIYVALFDRLKTIDGLATTSRKLKHWNDVPPEQQPALYQTQVSETPRTNVNGEPPVWVLNLDIYLYVRTADENESPCTTMNSLIDAIEQQLKPDYPTQRNQTLGGLAQWVRIEGTIETSEGTLGDQAVAIIPIQILTA